MIKTIWKFALESASYNDVTMPTDSEILCLQLQNNTPCLWALVDPDLERPRITRRFVITGTGHDLAIKLSKRDYIGTFQIPGLVFHVFEVQQ